MPSNEKNMLLPKFLKAINHAQFTGLSPEQAMDYGDEIDEDIRTLSATPEGKKQIGPFRADAPVGVDPFTGATARDYASLMLTPVKALQGAGHNTVGAFGIAAAGFMKQLDEVADFIAEKTGMEKGGIFKKAYDVALEKGAYYKEKAKEEGIGPITEFITDVAGGVVPGMVQFMIDKLGLVHGLSAAERTRQGNIGKLQTFMEGGGFETDMSLSPEGGIAGTPPPTMDSEFTSFLKGSMERLLLGQVFHAASTLQRPYRAGVTGVLFEEQARSAGERDPAELAKAFLTGGIFGSIGGPGKIGAKDVVREMRLLEKEAGKVEFVPAQGGAGDSLIGGERGSTGAENTPPIAKGFFSPTAKVVESLGEKAMPAPEWNKRITAWEGKYGGLTEENKWSGVHEWLAAQEGSVTKGDVLGFLELSKKGWLEKVQPSETDPWASYNIPGGIPGTEKVFAFRVPRKEPVDQGELDALKGEVNDLLARRQDFEKVGDFESSNRLAPRYDMLNQKVHNLFVGPIQYISSHFTSIPDVVFHVRTHKMIDAQGNIGLMVETVQSDWHQHGKSYGYNTGEAAEAERNLIVADQKYRGMYGENGEAWPAEARERIKDLYHAWTAAPPLGPVAMGPFEKTWHEAALKQVIDMAAQDPEVAWIGWPSGKVQMLRWGKIDGEEIYGGENFITIDPNNPQHRALRQEIYDRIYQEFIVEEGREPSERELVLIHSAAIERTQEELSRQGFLARGGIDLDNPRHETVFDEIHDDLYQKFIVEEGREPTKKEEEGIYGEAMGIAEGKLIDQGLIVEGGNKPPGTDFLEVLYDSKLPKFGKKYGGKLGGVYKEDTLSPMDSSRIRQSSKENGGVGPIGTWEYIIDKEGGWVTGFDSREEASTYMEENSAEDPIQYPIHRIDLPPAAKDKVLREGQSFYMGIDPTQLPRVLKELGENIGESFPILREVGIDLYRGGKKLRHEWVEAMKATAGPEWKKHAGQIEQVWEYLAAAEADTRKYRPALKVGTMVFEANPDETIHGQVWNSIPPEILMAVEEGKVSLESGWVDKEGKWVEGKMPAPEEAVKQEGGLTPEEQSSLEQVVHGGKGAVKAHPTIAMILKETAKALSPRKLHNIKNLIRKTTGQIKVSNIIEMREDKALSEQLRYAARQAKIAFREGKKEGVSATSERFHLSLEKAKARKEAAANVRTWIQDLKAIDPSTMMDYARTEITMLLGDIDLTRLSSPKRLSLEKTREYLGRSPDTELPEYVLDDLARLDKMPVRDLTYDQMESLHAAVMNLAAQSRLGQRLWDGVQERRYKDAMEDSIAELKAPESILGDIISTKPSLHDKVLSVGHWVGNTLGLRQDSYDLIVETLAGINSTPYRVLYRMVKRGDPTGVIPGGGIIGQKAYVQDAHANFRKDLERVGFPFDKVGNVDTWLNERVEVQVDSRTWTLSRGERMALYRHSLNPDNLAAILEGGIGFKRPPATSNIKPNTVITLTEGDVAGIIESLSPEELLFAGKPVDNLFQKQGQLLGDTFYTLNRYRMKLEDVYYPKDVMPLTRGGYDLETEEGLETFRQYTARVGIDKGMLVGRTGSAKPIYLGDLMGDITKSVDRAAAYIHLEGPMRNASHLLYGPDTSFRKAIIDRYGRDTWVELEKGLKDIANNYRSWTETEKGLMSLKTGVVSSVVSLNPWIWLNQPASLMFYNTYIDMKYLARGLADVATPSGTKKVLDLALGNSPELVERLMTGYDRDVAAAYQAAREREYYGGEHTVTEKMILPTKWADMTAVLPGMRAAYYKAMDELQGKAPSKSVRDALDLQDISVVDKWTPEQLEAKAWEFADWVTERTQAQAGMEHRPPLSRGTTAEQMFTALSSQVNTMLNLARRTKREYERTGLPEDRGAMYKAYIQVFVLNAVAMMGMDRVRDLLYGRDSKSFVHGFIDNAASMVMFLRDVEGTVSSHLFEGERGFDSKIPIQKPVEIMGKMATSLHTMVISQDQKAVERAQEEFVDLTLDLLATLKGLPYHTPKRIVDAATGNNPPPKRRREPDFVDELIE